MENLKGNKLIKFGIIITSAIIGIIGIFSIFITAYFNSTFYHAEEKTYFKYSFGTLEILFVIFLTMILFLLVKKILKKIPSYFLLIAICICSFSLFIYWINALRLNPESDQKLIHEMAIALLNGNIGNYLNVSQYLFLYPYQFPFTILVSLIYKIFGENFLYLEYFNAICSVLNIIIIFYISKLIFKNEQVQKILSILLGLFSLYWMFFNVHFYGNIIGFTFALLACLFTLLHLEKDKKIFIFLSGILIAISALIKTNYNIFLCGILVILALKTIKNFNIKSLIVPITFILGFSILTISYNLIVTFIYNINLPKGVPMTTFLYMGMAEPTDLSPGWYTGDTLKIYTESNFDEKLAKQKTFSLIKDRLIYFLNNPKIFISYYSEKIGSTWLNPTFQTIWCSLPSTRYRWYPEYAHYLGYHEKVLSMVGGNLYKIEEKYFDIIQITIFIFASIGIFKTSKDTNYSSLLLIIIFTGGFVFHILWETKAIYVIQYYFLLLPFSAFGINITFDKAVNFYKKAKTRKLTS